MDQVNKSHENGRQQNEVRKRDGKKEKTRTDDREKRNRLQFYPLNNLTPVIFSTLAQRRLFSRLQ